ncbi:hypothetical protein KAH37_04300 [bacterium]|nr:hypothetical protein [bacterium]
MRVEQISVLLRNELGVLSDILKSFTAKKVNIMGLTINETTSFGELRLIVDNVALAKSLLDEGVVDFNIIKILLVELEDKPGALMNIALMLSDNNINIDYLYTLSSGMHNSYVAIKTWNMDETEQLLAKEGMKVVSIEDIKI